MPGVVPCATCNPVSAHEVVGALQLSVLAAAWPHQHKILGRKYRSVRPASRAGASPLVQIKRGGGSAVMQTGMCCTVWVSMSCLGGQQWQSDDCKVLLQCRESYTSCT